jgi:hypothetical protein
MHLWHVIMDYRHSISLQHKYVDSLFSLPRWESFVVLLLMYEYGSLPGLSQGPQDAWVLRSNAPKQQDGSWLIMHMIAEHLDRYYD